MSETKSFNEIMDSIEETLSKNDARQLQIEMTRIIRQMHGKVAIALNVPPVYDSDEQCNALEEFQRLGAELVKLGFDLRDKRKEK